MKNPSSLFSALQLLNSRADGYATRRAPAAAFTATSAQRDAAVAAAGNAPVVVHQIFRHRSRDVKAARAASGSA